MQVIVKGHHIHVSDHLRDTAVHKLQKLNRFFDRIIKVDVQFSHEKVPAPAQHQVEVAMTTPLGSVRAHAQAAEPEAAVDAVVEKLERQIKRMKDKVVRNPKGGIRAKAAPKLSKAASADGAVSPNGTKAAAPAADASQA
jgi:ribosomal subunit interface protein